MQPRIKSPAFTLPRALEALRTLSASSEDCGVPPATLELVHLRVGQINGCSVCVDLHTRVLKKLGESDTRLFTLSAWREAPYYTDAERAALALAESVTRLADRPEAVSEEIWAEASRHFTEVQLGALVMAASLANLWNRVNAATRQPSGEWIEQYLEERARAHATGGGAHAEDDADRRAHAKDAE